MIALKTLDFPNQVPIMFANPVSAGEVQFLDIVNRAATNGAASHPLPPKEEGFVPRKTPLLALIQKANSLHGVVPPKNGIAFSEISSERGAKSIR